MVCVPTVSCAAVDPPVLREVLIRALAGGDRRP